METQIKATIVAGVDQNSLNRGVKQLTDTGKKINEGLRAKFEVDVANAQQKLQQLRAQLKNKDLTGEQRLHIQIETNRASRNLTELQRQLKNIETTGDPAVSRLQTKFDSLKSGILNAANAARIFISALVVRGVQQAGSAIIQLAGNLEQAEIAFTTMLGSAEKATTLLQELTDFAKKTPFELTGIRQTAKQLLAFGFSAEEIIPTLKSLGDVSAGLSVPIEQVAYAYGQVRTANQLYGTELRQFMNAGVPLLAELAKMFGVTETAVKKMVEEGKVGFKDVEVAFQRMSGEGGKFANLMEAQSQTLQGAWSNLKDSLSSLGEVLGTLFIPALRSIVDFITPLIQKINIWSQEHPKLAKTIAMVVAGLTALVGVMGVLGLAIGPLIAGFSLLLGPIGIIIGAVAGLTAGIILLDKAFNPLHTKSLPELQKELAKTNDKIDELEKKFADGEISAKRYEKQIAKLKDQQKETNDMITIASSKAMDYQARLEDLARIKMRGNAIEYKMARDRYIADAKAAEALANSLAKLFKMQQLTSGTDTIKKTTGLQIGLDLSPVSAFNKMAETAKQKVKTVDEDVDDIIKKLVGSANVNIPSASSVSGTKKATDDIAKSFEKAFDSINKDIDDSSKKLEGYLKDLDDVNKKLDELERTKETDIASRVVLIDQEKIKLDKEKLELQKELQKATENDERAKINEELLALTEKQNALDTERKEAFAGLTEEQARALQELIDKQSEYNSLSDIGKIKADYEEKKLQLEQEKLDLETKIANEQALYEGLNRAKKQLIDDYTAQFKKNIKEEEQALDGLIQKYKDVALAAQQAASASNYIRSGTIPGRAIGGPVYAGSPYIVGEKGPELFIPNNSGKIIPNNQLTNNININANVSNDIELDKLANALAQKIALSRKGIF